jgi:hypothetical protein
MGSAASRNVPPSSDVTLTGKRAVNPDRLKRSLSVFENFSCLQDIWLKDNERKTSRNCEERTEESNRVSK